MLSYKEETIKLQLTVQYTLKYSDIYISMFHPGPENCRTYLKAFKMPAALVCRDVLVD